MASGVRTVGWAQCVRRSLAAMSCTGAAVLWTAATAVATMAAAADLSGYRDVRLKVNADAIAAQALAEPGHHMRLQHQPVGGQPDMRSFKVGVADPVIVAQIPSSLAVEQLLHDQGLHTARTQRECR